MRFKTDENLPDEFVEILRHAGLDAISVKQESHIGISDDELAKVCVAENRVLPTLDMDFADIRKLPSGGFPGLVIFRVQKQGRRSMIRLLHRLLPVLTKEILTNRLCIIEEDRVRIRTREI